MRLTTSAVGKATLPRLIIGVLLSGVPQDVNEQLLKELDDKVSLVRSDCLRETANKFGFIPKKPY